MLGNRPGKRTQQARRLNGPSRTRNGCYPDRFHRAGQSALKNASPSGNRGRDLSMRLIEAAAQSQESGKVHPEHLENSERLARLEAL